MLFDFNHERRWFMVQTNMILRSALQNDPRLLTTLDSRGRVFICDLELNAKLTKHSAVMVR